MFSIGFYIFFLLILFLPFTKYVYKQKSLFRLDSGY